MSVSWVDFLRPGEVVIADVRNPHEEPGSEGKHRPTVWLGVLPDGRHAIAGLTTKTHFDNGRPRTKLVDTPGCGAVSYLWGGKLVIVDEVSLIRPTGDRLGPVDMAAALCWHGAQLHDMLALDGAPGGEGPM